MEEFKNYKGYLIGNNGTIKNKKGLEMVNHPNVVILGKSYKRKNLIARMWLDDYSRYKHVTCIDGNHRNLSVENLKYK